MIKLVEEKDYVEMYYKQEVCDLISECILYPTDGKVKNVIKSVYSKHQGSIYLAMDEDKLVGIIGTRMVDRKCEIFQIAVKEELRKKGYGKQIIKELIVISEGKVDEFFVALKAGSKEFFIKNAFTLKKVTAHNPDFDMQDSVGILKVKK